MSSQQTQKVPLHMNDAQLTEKSCLTCTRFEQKS